jgi:hypothetical protein
MRSLKNSIKQDPKLENPRHHVHDVSERFQELIDPFAQ